MYRRTAGMRNWETGTTRQDRGASVRLVYAGPIWLRCDRRDSNPHGLPHQLLRLARLPIPPRSQTSAKCILSRFLMSFPYTCGAIAMFHRRLTLLIAGLTLCAVYATLPAAQVSDKDKICSQVENRTFTVGTWASYNWTGGSSPGSTMRISVVGKEPHEGTTYYWYEVAIEDPL